MCGRQRYCPIVSLSSDNSVESLRKATKLPIIWAASSTWAFQRAHKRTQSRTVTRYTAAFPNASSKDKTPVLHNTVFFFKSYLEKFTKNDIGQSEISHICDVTQSSPAICLIIPKGSYNILLKSHYVNK